MSAAAPPKSEYRPAMLDMREAATLLGVPVPCVRTQSRAGKYVATKSATSFSFARTTSIGSSHAFSTTTNLTRNEVTAPEKAFQHRFPGSQSVLTTGPTRHFRFRQITPSLCVGQIMNGRPIIGTTEVTHAPFNGNAAGSRAEPIRT